MAAAAAAAAVALASTKAAATKRKTAAAATAAAAVPQQQRGTAAGRCLVLARLMRREERSCVLPAAAGSPWVPAVPALHGAHPLAHALCVRGDGHIHAEPRVVRRRYAQGVRRRRVGCLGLRGGGCRCCCLLLLCPPVMRHAQWGYRLVHVYACLVQTQSPCVWMHVMAVLYVLHASRHSLSLTHQPPHLAE